MGVALNQLLGETGWKQGHKSILLLTVHVRCTQRFQAAGSLQLEPCWASRCCVGAPDGTIIIPVHVPLPHLATAGQLYGAVLLLLLLARLLHCHRPGSWGRPGWLASCCCSRDGLQAE
jgi:hypothetical protein